MRIAERIIGIAVIGLVSGLTPAFGFDGKSQPAGVAPAVSVDVVPRSAGTAATAIPRPQMPVPNAPQAPALGAALGLNAITPDAFQKLSPTEAFRTGAQALQAGDTSRGVTALEYAADQGLAAAQWKLGRMYADGSGVAQNDLRAFEYFTRIANSHADDAPNTPRGKLVAKAFVSLGHYHLEGIANSDVKPDVERARQMYSYAASYFGDPDAQYHLARMLLEGSGSAKDPKQALRWFGLAANKGQYQAQAMLGSMMFRGQGTPRQAARGLMWLTLAREGANATAGAGEDAWIKELYDAAIRQTNEDERAMAAVYLEQYMRGARR